MNINWNFVLSIITAIVAILALIQSQYQIRVNNKQHLFDKRVENYLVIDGLMQLYRNNLSYFEEKKDKVLLANDLSFTWLTNNSYLEEISPAIKYPLEEPYHKALLLKLENIKEVATKSSFLYKGNSGQLLRDFVMSYQELLFKIYQYQILLKHMENNEFEPKMSLEEAQEYFNEEKQRTELQEAITHLKQSYDKLVKKNIEEKIKKKIRL